MNKYKLTFENNRTCTIECEHSGKPLQDKINEAENRFNSPVAKINDQSVKKHNLGGFILGSVIGGMLGKSVPAHTVSKTAKSVKSNTKKVVRAVKKQVKKFDVGGSIQEIKEMRDLYDDNYNRYRIAYLETENSEYKYEMEKWLKLKKEQDELLKNALEDKYGSKYEHGGPVGSSEKNFHVIDLKREMMGAGNIVVASFNTRDEAKADAKERNKVYDPDVKMFGVKTTMQLKKDGFYKNGGLTENQEEQFQEWIADGNVVENADGTYSTQDAQYRNKLKNLNELRKYFKKEFLYDQYEKGGPVASSEEVKKHFSQFIVPEYVKGSSQYLYKMLDPDRKEVKEYFVFSKSNLLPEFEKFKAQFEDKGYFLTKNNEKIPLDELYKYMKIVPYKQESHEFETYYADGGLVGKQIVFERYGEERIGKITEDLGDGRLSVVSGSGSHAITPENIVSFIDTPEKKKGWFSFKDGGKLVYHNNRQYPTGSAWTKEHNYRNKSQKWERYDVGGPVGNPIEKRIKNLTKKGYIVKQTRKEPNGSWYYKIQTPDNASNDAGMGIGYVANSHYYHHTHGADDNKTGNIWFHKNTNNRGRGTEYSFSENEINSLLDQKENQKFDVGGPVETSEQKYRLLSPDGFDIEMDAVYTESELMPAFEKFKKRFEKQGYYSTSNRTKIDLRDLQDYMQVVEYNEIEDYD